ncbi:MAG: hypothetical protein ACREPT_01615 [Rudaea sp.]
MRGALAVAAGLWALLFLVAPDRLVADPVYAFMTRVVPTWFWAVLFATDALGLAWRIFERCPRVGWSRFINAFTVGLWALYLACAIDALGYVAPDFADDITLLLCAVWCALRTDITISDRESA